MTLQNLIDLLKYMSPDTQIKLVHNSVEQDITASTITAKYIGTGQFVVYIHV